MSSIKSNPSSHFPTCLSQSMRNHIFHARRQYLYTLFQTQYGDRFTNAVLSSWIQDGKKFSHASTAQVNVLIRKAETKGQNVWASVDEGKMQEAAFEGSCFGRWKQNASKAEKELCLEWVKEWYETEFKDCDDIFAFREGTEEKTFDLGFTTKQKEEAVEELYREVWEALVVQWRALKKYVTL